MSKNSGAPGRPGARAGSKEFTLTMALSSCHAVARKAFTSRIVKLAAWDVTADLVTIYDKLHADALDYVTAADPAAARRIAESLRSMLEKFVRIAYPQYFKADSMLGQFADLARQRVNTPQAILGPKDTPEIRALLDFASRYHHDENPAYQVEAINDGELLDFVKRTLAFTSRALG